MKVLKKAIKKSWLEALRSGKYKQGYCHPLSRINQGVFADVVICGDWLPISYLPPDVQNFLIEMNDTGKSFTEIADWIEENL